MRLKFNTCGIYILFCIGCTGLNAQQNIAISLFVNGSHAISIDPGLPIRAECVISCPDLAFRANQNQRIAHQISVLEDSLAQYPERAGYFRAEIDSLTFDAYPEDSVVLGTPVLPWHEHLSWHVTREGFEQTGWHVSICDTDTDPMLVLSADRRWRFNFWISYPKAVGTFQLSASLDSVISNPVAVTLSTRSVATAQSEEELLSIGNDYLMCDKPVEALRYSEQVLTLRSTSINGLLLKADALYALDQMDKALENYQKALEQFNLQFPDEYEVPEYIMHRINILK